MFSIINTRSALLSVTALLLAGLGACAPVKVADSMDDNQLSDESSGLEDTGSPADDGSGDQNEDPGSVDGEFMLYAEGDGKKPWKAYCAGRPDQPQEYLPLSRSGGGSNEAQYPCDGAAWGSTVWTTVYAVSINPRTFKVDSRDLSFSSSGGECNTFTLLTELPWGYAGTCNGDTNGTANIDLAGTPFVVAADAFAVEGWEAGASAKYRNGGRQVDLHGGGYCGSMSPASADGSITLKYTP
jgi:GON domain